MFAIGEVVRDWVKKKRWEVKERGGVWGCHLSPLNPLFPLDKPSYIDREKAQHIQRVKVLLTLSPKNTSSMVRQICENLHFNCSFSLVIHSACLVFIASEKSHKRESWFLLTPSSNLAQTLHSLHCYYRDCFKRQTSSSCSKPLNDSPLLSRYIKIPSAWPTWPGLCGPAQFSRYTSLHIVLGSRHCYSLAPFQIPEHDMVLSATGLLDSSSLMWRTSLIPSIFTHYPSSPSSHSVVTFSGSTVLILRSTHAMCVHRKIFAYWPLLPLIL